MVFGGGGQKIYFKITVYYVPFKFFVRLYCIYCTLNKKYLVTDLVCDIHFRNAEDLHSPFIRSFHSGTRVGVHVLYIISDFKFIHVCSILS